MALLAIPPPDDAGEHDIGYTPIVIVLSPRYDASVVGPRTRVFLLKISAVRYQIRYTRVVSCVLFLFFQNNDLRHKTGEFLCHKTRMEPSFR